MTSSPTIYGPDGQPIDMSVVKGGESARLRSATSLMNVLFDATTSSPFNRASEPFPNHSWVYVGAMALAINLLQAPFTIMRELPKAREVREQVLRDRGSTTARIDSFPRSGSERRAMARYTHDARRISGLPFKHSEEFPDHPFTKVLHRPNDVISSLEQLITATVLWLTIKGECFWLYLSESGDPLQFGQTPSQIWCLNPSAFQPLYDKNRLIGWRLIPYSRDASPINRAIDLSLNEVAHFKYYNPRDPIRGLSPLVAAMMSVEFDILAQRSDRAALINGNNPGGVLVEKTEMFSSTKEREAYQEDFNQRYSGADANRRVMILANGLEWVPIGMTPQEMERLGGRSWTRDEVLSVIGVPKASVGVTDGLPYAAQVVQDRNLWRNRLLPLAKLIEGVVDSSLFFPETDDVYAAFNTSCVEALRAGLSEQITIANNMSGSNLHVPPRVAFQTVGVEVPEFEGDDKCLVSPALVTVQDVLEGIVIPSFPPAQDGQQTGQDGTGTPPGENGSEPGDTPREPVGGGDGEPGADPNPTAQGDERKAASVVRARVDAKRYWAIAASKLMDPLELLIGPAWVKWVLAQRKEQLAKFDEVTSTRKRSIMRADEAAIDIEAILLGIAESRNALTRSTMLFYQSALESVFNFTVSTDLGGTPVFGIDDPRLQEVMEVREQVLIGSAPMAIQTSLRRTLRRGIDAGETINELRARVGRVYDINATPAKTLMVARTETGGMVSGVRDEMFGGAGFSSEQWSTSGDEHVRTSHVAYGEAGAKPRGFNYLTIRPSSLPKLSGELRYPHDMKAPAAEVVSCRCVKIPVE